MIKAILIEEELFIEEENKPVNAYRLYFEDNNGERSIDKTYEYTNIELKKGKIYCGRETFFDIPNDIITAHFEYKYGNYFKNFSTCIMGPNFFLKNKILDFTTSNMGNILRKRYNRELLHVPKFSLFELIENSDLVFIQELCVIDYGATFLFFDSPVFDSKKYIKDIFEDYGFNIIDKT
ncbi:hypothetical protein [Acinetobacter sp. ABJ-A23_2]|uniref:hypothetical protein n=1 Tax=Acinetobacter sp. ABJ-A23_2 TaxID=3376991 RepID=UPI0037C556E2